MTVKRLIAGLAIGAGLMYLFDPKNGKERRRRLRDRIDDARSGIEQRIHGGMDTAEDYTSEFQKEFGRASKRASRATSDVAGDARDTRDRAAEAAVEALSGTLD